MARPARGRYSEPISSHGCKELDAGIAVRGLEHPARWRRQKHSLEEAAGARQAGGARACVCACVLRVRMRPAGAHASAAHVGCEEGLSASTVRVGL